MSILTTHTTATRATPSGSNIGLCKFNTTNSAIEVSDGTNWLSWANDGVYSQVASFDGTNDYIDTGTRFDFLQQTCEFTATCWVKFTDHTSTAANQFLLGNTNSGSQVGMMLWYDNRTSSGSNKTLRVMVSPATGATGDVFVNVSNGITDNNWHHIAVTGSGSGGTLKMYRDGSVIGSTSGLTTTADTSLHDMQLGAVGGASPVNFLGGYLDEVAFFESELSSGDITNLISSHNYTGATSLYKFEGNANDSIGSNNGTNNGATFEGAIVGL